MPVTFVWSLTVRIDALDDEVILDLALYIFDHPFGLSANPNTHTLPHVIVTVTFTYKSMSNLVKDGIDNLIGRLIEEVLAILDDLATMPTPSYTVLRAGNLKLPTIFNQAMLLHQLISCALDEDDLLKRSHVSPV